MNKLFILLLFSILISCSSLKEADKVLRNEKIRTTDEFLVKKRDPLIYPPNYEEVPEPGSKNENQSDKDSIKQILKINEPDNKTNIEKPSSLEDAILRNIRK